MLLFLDREFNKANVEQMQMIVTGSLVHKT